MCSPSQRTYVGSLFLIPWAIGYMVVPGVAYLVRPWRWMQAVFTVPVFYSLIFFWLVTLSVESIFPFSSIRVSQVYIHTGVPNGIIIFSLHFVFVDCTTGYSHAVDFKCS